MAVDKFELADIMRAMAEGLASSGEITELKLQNKQLKATLFKFCEWTTLMTLENNHSGFFVKTEDVMNTIYKKDSEIRVDDDDYSRNHYKELVDKIAKEVYKNFMGEDYKEE